MYPTTPMTPFVQNIQKFKNSPKLHLWTDLHNSGCKWKILDDTTISYSLFTFFMPMTSYYDVIKSLKFKIGYDVTKSVILVGSQEFFFSWNPLPKTVILRYWSFNSVQKQKRYIQIRILITHRWRGVTFAFGGFYRA